VFPRLGEDRGVGGADEVGGIRCEHLVDGLFREELRRADGDRVGPVGQLLDVGEAAYHAGTVEAHVTHRHELVVQEAGVGQAEQGLVIHDTAARANS
jgi:hypothetical protein